MSPRTALVALALPLAIVACGPAARPASSRDTAGSTPAASQPAPPSDAPLPQGARAEAPRLPPVQPPAPGSPGGLPDDRTPVSEAPFTATSAQGAANVVQTYFALLAEGKYADAWRLWGGAGEASGMTEAAFRDSFARYASYAAQVGAPGAMEGAAGSSYVDVPVVIYGRLKTGAEMHQSGTATLRRVNDVPGSTAEQRRWHIARLELK